LKNPPAVSSATSPSVTSPKGPRILVVEDDASLRNLVCRYLEDFGFQVIELDNGRDVLAQVLRGVDAVVLDLHLPEMDGLEVIRQLRKSSSVPVVIVSARGEAVDRVAGLELGADDYLTKPFLPRELVARLRAMLRRAQPGSNPSIATPAQQAAQPHLVVNVLTRTVSLEGTPVDLTPKEYELLCLLFQAPGKTFTRDELLDRVWGPEYVGETRRVDLQISRLRNKLARPGKPALIASVWGVGYRFSP
jgi:DNA-binding response OmpR family regulator